MALPYCFSKVNWSECDRKKIEVAFDFLYIFFRLKYYPDNYSQCRLWEVDRKTWPYYYGSNYDPYQRKHLQVKLQPKVYEIIFKDKSITYQLCKANNLPTPGEVERIHIGEDIKTKLQSIFNINDYLNRVILKPIDGKGGSGVIFVEKTDNGSLKSLKGRSEIALESITTNEDLIAQEFVRQHTTLNKISESVNTVRIVTFLTDRQEVLIVGNYMRFGTGSSKIDNLSQGGICVAISGEHGCLKGPGYDRNSKIYHSHPTSNVFFDGFDIPLWKDVVELAVSTQKAFPFYRLLGLDIAITNDGPVIIEINSNYDNVDLEQACGPILTNPSILSAFSEHGLLFNNFQKRLAKRLKDEDE